MRDVPRHFHHKRHLRFPGTVIDSPFLFFDGAYRRSVLATKQWLLAPIYGGVPDSTLGWSAQLPVESRRTLANLPSKKTNGTYEEMPLAA
jgi:hypothetical protein